MATPFSSVQLYIRLKSPSGSNCETPVYDKKLSGKLTGTNLDIDIVCRDEPALPYLNEQIIHYLWAEQLFKVKSLETTDHRQVTVKYPGLWNHESGPDFKQAIIYFGNEPQKGDIEIHLYASDWYRHQHHTNPDYNKVILHLAGWLDGGTPQVKRADGYNIPQVVLSPLLAQQFEEIDDLLELDNWRRSRGQFSWQSRCRHLCLTPSYHSKLISFLEMAGETRLFLKSERFRKRQEQSALDNNELFYQGIMEPLGYRHNQANFLRLAQQISWSDLQKIVLAVPVEQRVLTIQALLLFAAGLIPADRKDRYDNETVGYLDKLSSAVKPQWTTKQTGLNWTLKGTRPVNYPSRRIAGVSYFLSRFLDTDFVSEILTAWRTGNKNRSLLKILNTYFAVPSSEYWHTRNVLGGRKLGRRLNLIGDQCLHIIIVNAVIPLLLLNARRQNNASLINWLLEQYRRYEGGENNYITKFMSYRLFGNKKPAISQIKRRAVLQQGLIQLYQDSCVHGPETCNYCGLVKWLAPLETKGVN